MATVTGLTATRMLAIEAASVVDGEVVGDNLVLIRHDGGEIVAGNVRGPAGPSGGGGGGYLQEQSFPAATTSWTITHGQGTKGMSVYTQNSLGVPIRGDISYPDDNTVQVDFYHPQTGLMRVYN